MGEEPFFHAGAGREHLERGQVPHVGHTLHVPRPVDRVRADPGAGLLRLEDVLHHDRSAGRARRLDRTRVQDLRAEVRKLRGLVVRQGGEGERLRDNLRVRAHEAADVLPDLDERQSERIRHDGGAVIRAAPSERGGLPLRRLPEEPRDDADVPGALLAAQERRHVDLRLFEQGARVAVVFVRHEADLIGLERDRVDAVGPEIRGDDLGCKALSEREGEVLHARGDFLRVRDAVQKTRQLRAKGLDRLDGDVPGRLALRKETEMHAPHLGHERIDLLLRAGLADRGEERIRHARDCRDHEEPPRRVVANQGGDPTVHVGLAHAGAAELRQLRELSQNIPSGGRVRR